MYEEGGFGRIRVIERKFDKKKFALKHCKKLTKKKLDALENEITI